jgi:hypothetical protein
VPGARAWSGKPAPLGWPLEKPAQESVHLPLGAARISENSLFVTMPARDVRSLAAGISDPELFSRYQMTTASVTY